MMQQPLLYTYATLSINTYGKLMFSPGVSYYHNVIIMGLVKLYQADVITLNWIKEEHEVANFDARVKRKQELIDVITFSRINSLPDSLQEYNFLYEMIPETKPVNIIDFVTNDYREQRNHVVSDMQTNILKGLIERDLVFSYEKKGLFGKKKEQYKANPKSLDVMREDLRTIINEEEEMSTEAFMLCYFVQMERMLFKLYDKQEAKKLDNIVRRKITEQQQRDHLFLKLMQLIWFLEEHVFVNY